jgi:hypothetical protein
MAAELAARLPRAEDLLRSMMLITRRIAESGVEDRRLAMIEEACLQLSWQMQDIRLEIARREAGVAAELEEASRLLQVAIAAGDAVASRNGLLGAVADAQQAGTYIDVLDATSGIRVIYDPALDCRPFRPATFAEPVNQERDGPVEHLADMAGPAPSKVIPFRPRQPAPGGAA